MKFWLETNYIEIQLYLTIEWNRNRQRETSVAMSNPISTNTELNKKNTLDTNIVCMFTKVSILSFSSNKLRRKV